MTRCLLFQSGLPKEFWAEAMDCATYLRNRSPSSALNGQLPEEIVTGKAVKLDPLLVFGSVAYIHVPKPKRGKLDATSQKMVFLGYSDISKAYKFIDPEDSSKKIVRSRDASFIEESHFDYQHDVDFYPDIPDLIEIPIFESKSVSEQPVINEIVVPEHLHEEVIPGYHERERRYPVRNRKIKREEDYVYLTDLALLSVSPDDPMTVVEALSRSDANKWQAAMQEEMDSLTNNSTWELVPRPDDVRPISTKWVFKLKRDATGTPTRYKARLVARGFNQRYGVDYVETYSPTVNHDTVRMLFALAVKHNWSVHHIDVATAFLQGELEERLFIEQPEGFRSGPEVCKLKKAIYGLKQASRAWNETLRKFLLGSGFTESRWDSCVLFKGSIWQYMWMIS